ncbi:MAG: hypothetical protein BEU05_03020 [Marine Group III euryarchaeote CG-Bathy2]|uniref:Uncharacterized protein n=3 Tax=Methanobacteriati TaxID=3366610 RepID=A0A075HBW9_9EURY|nr:hypothetical protein [uncultured marine group II/III euryarchaeote KM3_200_A03]AIF14026.1 hypothetical protein [uncultured marine group II/III euryarchaeote KM3_65_G10]OIR12572.1 MAG: hypothetical protein BEU05_03020 [Marine Group III euryarchaeote CG-Bathy2]
MAGDDEDVLLEIDRILAGEDEETQAESEADAGEAEAEDDGDEAPLADFDFGGDYDGEAAEPDDAGGAPAVTGAPERIGRAELVAILLSRKTKLHFMALLALLAAFMLLRNISVDLLLMLGYGGTLGYLLTGALTRLEAVRELSRSEHPTSLALPLVLGALSAGGIFWGLRNPDWGDSLRSTLGLGLVVIFIVWQFAQAWWMRVPFREFALARVEAGGADASRQGQLLNALSPALWMVAGFVIFIVLARYSDSFSDQFSPFFQFTWVGLMLGLGTAVFLLLRRMQGDAATNPGVAAFSGWFALGYWGFLAYHAGVLLYSLSRDPSFMFDLLFMFVTILVAIYSLSVQALKAEGIINRHNVIFYATAFTIAYGASSFFLTADEGVISDTKTVGRVAHVIVLASGMLVLLLVNYNFLRRRNLIEGSFTAALRGQ